MGAGITGWGATALVAALFQLGPTLPGFWVALLSSEAGEDMDGAMATQLEPLALVTDPDDDSVVTASSYTRRHIGIGSAAWALDSDTVTNTADIVFPVPTANWGRIDHWALLDAQLGGHLYCWSELPEPAYISVDWQLVIPAGGLVLALTSLDSTYNQI